MAQPTNTQETYTTIGIREDLSDIIYNIAPTDTPFMQSIGRASATQTKHEWQTDTLDTAALNAQVEGDDVEGGVGFEAADFTQRLFNHTQIASKAIVISGTVDAVDKAGRTRETAYQIAKRAKEIKRDMEFGLTQNTAVDTGAAAGAGARQAGGYETWILTNDQRAAGGLPTASTNGQPNNAAQPTDGAPLQAFDEADLVDVIQQCWTQGGDPDCIMVGPFNKTALSLFNGRTAVERRVNHDQVGTRLITAIDVYESDFGVHQIVPNRFQREESALVIDKDFWAIAYLRTFRQFPLARTGDAEKRQLLAEFTLEARNEKSSGIVADLTTS